MRLIDADALTASLKESADRCRDWIQECFNIKDDVTQRVAEQALLTFSECYLRIEKMPTVESQRWIPVTERQPEYGVEVLTINTDGDYEINHIIYEEDAEWFINGVIAWCELPEPYKEEQNEID